MEYICNVFMVVAFNLHFLSSLSFDVMYADNSKSLSVIADSVKKLSEQSFHDGPLFTALTGAFFAAIAAFVFNYLHWIFTRRKDNISSLAANTKQVIAELAEVSVNYWLGDVQGKTNETLAQEFKIKALLRLQISYYNLLRKLIIQNSEFYKFLLRHENVHRFLLFGAFKGKITQIDEREKKLTAIYENMTKVFDYVSGGSFGASSRSSDHGKASKISFACAQLDVQLSEILFGS